MIVKWAIGVKQGKALVKEHANIQMKLGKLADQIEPKYGEQTLAKLAEAIGIAFITLNNYRTVYRSYNEKNPRGLNSISKKPSKAKLDNSFSVHKVFAAQPDRQKLVQEKQWTTREAEELVQERKMEEPKAKQHKRMPEQYKKSITAMSDISRLIGCLDDSDRTDELVEKMRHMSEWLRKYAISIDRWCAGGEAVETSRPNLKAITGGRS